MASEPPATGRGSGDAEADADSAQRPHVHYALAIDTVTQEPTTGLDRTGSETDGPLSPSLRRTKSARAPTFKTVSDYDEFDSARPGWQPGAEPGFDPSKDDAGHASMPTLSAPCEITIVDFSQERMNTRHYDNESFIQALHVPQEAWVKCRWINVNGLSWDVVQAIGAHKNLHKLALEDVMEQKNRTKADWFPTHAFVVLTLQKIVYLLEDDSDSNSSSESESESVNSKGSRTMGKKLKRALSKKKRRDSVVGDIEKAAQRAAGGQRTAVAAASRNPHMDLQSTSMIRTLQRYHASTNEARTDFMEKNSSLASRNLAVSAEQVAIFLTSDNTVITFFEASAADVERPIVKRLYTPGTILRQSCDASLLVQAVIDAIIDLALPLTAVYNDVLGDIELAVLTDPSIKQSKGLYIVISEMNKMLSFLNPIDNLVNVLRDHRTSYSQAEAVEKLQDPTSGVIITPMTQTYLGDVLDHCIIITEAMQQIKQSADNLINLIFNTNSANVNERMKQLTTISMIFLPLTFITGFFGQNFEVFPEVNDGGNITYFWKCAVPTVAATVLIIMFNPIKNTLFTLRERQLIRVSRRAKEREQKRRMKKRRRE